MKKIFLFTLLLIISCSSENTSVDNEQQEEPVTIYGKWYYDYYTLNGEKFDFDYENEGCDSDFEKGFIDFKENGEYSISVFQGCEWVTLDGYSYVLKGNKLTKSKEGFPDENNEVVEMSESKLVLLNRHDNDGDGEMDDYIEFFKR